MEYLLDTNHASKLLEGNKAIVSKVAALKNNGSQFSISPSILGELFFAVYASKRKEENLSQLPECRKLVITILPFRLTLPCHPPMPLS